MKSFKPGKQQARLGYSGSEWAGCQVEPVRHELVSQTVDKGTD